MKTPVYYSDYVYKHSSKIHITAADGSLQTLHLRWKKFTVMARKIRLVTRKPVFGVFDQVRLKLDCSATETS